MEGIIKIISDGTIIRQDKVTDAVKKGDYNAMNWHEFSKLITDEIAKQHDVVFDLGLFARMNFKHREWSGIGAETIHKYVMMVVKGKYSHDVADLPFIISSAFL